jgi:cobalt/nickel transport system permease protein
MHIPDGYVSPATFVLGYIVFTPLLILSFKKLTSKLSERTLPLISALSALSFVIMMLNIPIPGGTSGHAIGTAAISILIDPWIASLSVSIVLLIQALFFGDGGITTWSLNSLAMGFLASFSGFYTYRALNRFLNQKISSFISGWTSIVVASFFVAVVLGIQPLIASENGKALYFPFDLKVTIPAIVLSHMLYFGIAEGIYTTIVTSFIRKVREER